MCSIYIPNFHSEKYSLFIFSVLTSFSLNFNFSTQIKSLFIFCALTSFFPFQFFHSNRKFVYFQRFDEFFSMFSGPQEKRLVSIRQDTVSKYIWS